MFGYIYITTNNVNGKKYIGQKTSDKFLGNKYLGSGEALQLAITKYGKDNFSVKMIESCNSRHELNIREAYYIKYYNAVIDDNFYNMKEGGHGGSIKGMTHHSEAHKQYMSIRMSGKNNPNYGAGTNHWTIESRRRVSAANSGSGNPNYGNHVKDTTKKLIAEKARNRVWIHNDIITKHVKLQDLDAYIKNGWQRGRLPYSSTTIENNVIS